MNEVLKSYLITLVFLAICFLLAYLTLKKSNKVSGIPDYVHVDAFRHIKKTYARGDKGMFGVVVGSDPNEIKKEDLI